MSAKITYQITALAGKWVAGYRLPLDATTIDLTPEEAEYDLLAGTIVPPGQPLPTLTTPAAVEGSDVFGLVRAGGSRSASIADLVAYLVSTGAVASGQAVAINAVLTTIRGTADPDHNTLGKPAAAIASLAVNDIGGLRDALAAKATPGDVAAAKAALRTALLNGADAAHDTLGEIQVILQGDDETIAGLLTTIGARLVTSNNLSEIATAGAAARATARTHFGLGDIATMTLVDVIAAVRDALNGKEF